MSRGTCRDVEFQLELFKRSARRLDARESPEALLQHVNSLGGQIVTMRAAVKRLMAASQEE